MQVTLQVVPVHTASPLVGSTHAVHPFAVQPEATLLLATQVVGLVAGQPWNPCEHVAPQVAPLQAGVPFGTAAHAVHPLAVQPDATLLLATQVPAAADPHRWKPVLQARTHAPPALHVTVPLAGAVQTVQLLPHDMGLVLPLMTQVAVAPVPHKW